VASAAGIVLTVFLFLPSVYQGYHPRITCSPPLIKSILPYSFANYAANLFNGLPGFLYPLMVINVLGAEQSAYFYIAWMFSMVLAIIPSSFSQSLLAESAYDSANLGRNCLRALLLSLLVAVPAVAALMFLGGWFLSVFGREYSQNGVLVLRYLCISIIPMSVNIIFLTINQVRKRLSLIIIHMAALGTIALVLGYVLLRSYGLPGIGLAFTIAHLLVALVVTIPLVQVIRRSRRSSTGELISN